MQECCYLVLGDIVVDVDVGYQIDQQVFVVFVQIFCVYLYVYCVGDCDWLVLCDVVFGVYCFYCGEWEVEVGY